VGLNQKLLLVPKQWAATSKRQFYWGSIGLEAKKRWRIAERRTEKTQGRFRYLKEEDELS
jgi:hypothetical protein